MTLMTKAAVGGLALGLAVTLPGAASAVDISGAGASFPAPIYQKWAEDYRAATQNAVNYQSVGSGAGVRQITARTVTFGASDRPLEPAELNEAGLVQFPMVMGGVVPVVNLEGVTPGQLTLDGATLAQIFMGEITSWDDEAIAALNPGVELPGEPIAVAHRADSSGTSFVFTDYLSKISPEWQEQVGADTSVEWPTGIGAKGNEGVASTVQQTAGAIGYVEYAYAKQNGLSYAKVMNADGQAAEPGIPSFQAAAAGADWANAEGFNVVLTNEPGAQSWPITSATFILIPREPQDGAQAAAALDFFNWAYENGDQSAQQLDYVPMPDEVVELVKREWSESIMFGGKPVWTASR